MRKTRQTTRPEISDSGIPNRVLRKAGLWNIEALERRLWNADQRREVREAEQQRARENKAAMAGLPRQEKAAEQTASTSVETASVVRTSGSTSPDEFALAAATATASVPTRLTIKPSTSGSTASAPKISSQKERTRPVTPGEFLQKSWQERRHTKVLLLNPRSYAYTESNAAIGRLSSKTMYRAPWEIGGRKSRFRSRRRRIVAKMAKLKADKELVRREKEKERLADEKKRLAKLEKQRAKGAKRASEAAKAGAGASAKAEKPVVSQGAETAAEVKKDEKPVVQAAEKPVAAKEGDKPAES